MFCLSKGLGAPVGSILAGNREFIDQARRFRKMLGGGMRQVGILAAAGLYALEHHIAKLAEDHDKAQLLSAQLQKIAEIALEPVETNIIIFSLVTMPAAELIARLKERGVLGLVIGPQKVRLVTHLDVSTSEILEAAAYIREILEK